MSQDGEGQDGKSGWYPGKFVGKAMRRSSTSSAPSAHNVPALNAAAAQNVVNTPKVESARRASIRTTASEDSPASPSNERSVSSATSTGECVAQNNARVPIATVRVKINEVRFLTIKSAKLSIELDDMAAVNFVSDWSYPIVRDFELLNITSDIRLEFRGSGANPYGVVIVPVTSLLKFNGAPAPAKQTWREIYPYYEKPLQDFPRSNLKFKSSLPDLQGSAMVKPPVSLGFVSFEAEILLPNNVKNVLGLYLKPTPRIVDRSVAPPLTESDYSEVQLAVNQSKIQRDIQRIKTALFKPPASMEYFMSVPEIFVLILVVAFLILSISSYQVPLAVVLILLFNGIVTLTQRNTPATVWNEPGVTLTTGGPAPTMAQEEEKVTRNTLSSLGSTALSSIQTILRTNQGLQFQLNDVAHRLEVARNLLTFADPRVSMIIFGYSLAFAAVSSVLIAILSMSTYLVALASTLLAISASYEFLGEQLENLPSTSKYVKISTKVGKIISGMYNLLSKVPDELELQHRKIAAAQIVKEGGAEMLDAATAYQQS